MGKLHEKLPLKRLRAPFRNWRQARPFWAGLFVMFGGAVIILVPLAPLPIMLEIGMAAIAGVVLGLVLIIGGLFFWLMPSNRVFVAAITAACSVASLVASNLGGFIIGMMAGIIGSCMAFGWSPDKQQKPKKRPKPSRDDEPLNPLPWEREARERKLAQARGSEPVKDPYAKPEHAWPIHEPGPGQRPYR